MSAPDYIEELETVESKDLLHRIRSAIDNVQLLKQKKEQMEAQLRDLNLELVSYEHNILPDLFSEAGVEKIDNAILQPFYRANIAADWDPKRREQAFLVLESLGAGDLIKTEVTVKLGRGDLEKAQRLAKALESKGLAPSVKQSVHPQTLTAWLKECVERRKMTPPLDQIGGTVGQIVKIKEK